MIDSGQESKHTTHDPEKLEQKIKLLKMCLLDARLSLSRPDYAELLLILEWEMSQYFSKQKTEGV